MNHHIPLIDSGTLGTKGHVQVVIPGVSESYASQKDQDDNEDIPFCTLKMFPEETIHCVEWAKEKFAQNFNLKPQNFNNLIHSNDIDLSDPAELRLASKIIKMEENKPETFLDCLSKARKKF